MRRQIITIIHSGLLIALGFYVGITLMVYIYREGYFRYSDRKSYVNGYIQCLKDIESGTFQYIDMRTILIYPKNDSLIRIKVNHE